MKVIAITLMLLVATVYAQRAPGVAQLIARGHQLIAQGELDIQRHHELGRSALVHDLAAEIELVRLFIRELETAVRQHNAEEIRQLETQLRNHETRLAELNHQIETAAPVVTDPVAAALIANARRIIAKANADLARHRANGRVVTQLHAEITAVEALVKELETAERQHQAHEILVLEQRLLQHEIRLIELDEALNRGP